MFSHSTVVYSTLLRMAGSTVLWFPRRAELREGGGEAKKSHAKSHGAGGGAWRGRSGCLLPHPGAQQQPWHPPASPCPQVRASAAGRLSPPRLPPRPPAARLHAAQQTPAPPVLRRQHARSGRKSGGRRQGSAWRRAAPVWGSTRSAGPRRGLVRSSFCALGWCGLYVAKHLLADPAWRWQLA